MAGEWDDTDDAHYVIEVICSFDAVEQVLLTLRFEKERGPVDKETFFRSVAQALTRQELDQLRKLSCCQMDATSEADLFPFIAETIGKFYFGPGEWASYEAVDEAETKP